MPEDLLHDPDVGTAIEEVGRARMAQDMRMDLIAESGARPGGSDNGPTPLPGEAATATRYVAMASLRRSGRLAITSAHLMRHGPLGPSSATRASASLAARSKSLQWTSVHTSASRASASFGRAATTASRWGSASAERPSASSSTPTRSLTS